MGGIIIYLFEGRNTRPKRVYTKDVGKPFNGQFSDWFLINSPSISAAQNAHPQAVIFKVAEAIRPPLDQLHFAVETFCDAVIPRKTEHSGDFFPPIMQSLAQGAQRREGCFSKLRDFV